MIKIAIFSDVHGNLPALRSIIDDIKKENCDEIICLGDIVGIGPNPKECLDLIMDNSINLVLGNHELYYLLGTNIGNGMSEGEVKHQQWIKNKLGEKYKEFLKNCPLKIEKNYYNKKYLFQHFIHLQNPINNYPFEDLSIMKNNKINKIFSKMDYNYVFIGHEHKSFSLEINGNKLIDIGSSGCVKNNITNYTILKVSEESTSIEQKNIVYDRNQLIKQLNKEDYPDRNFISKIFFDLTI